MSDELDSPTQVSSVCLNLLLQELVPTSIRVSHRLAEQKREERAKNQDVQTRIGTLLSNVEKDLPGTVEILNSDLLDSEEVSIRIESYGYDVGVRLTEVLMYRAATRSKIVDILEVMKFICRDVWRAICGKQMDNLRTNHRGTFVLIDSNYKVTAGLCSEVGHEDTIAKARLYTYFPCGLIRGVLRSFGVEAYVTADPSQFPAITFNIQTAINN